MLSSSASKKRCSVITEPSTYTAIRSINCPNYALIDYGTARCRLPISVFEDLNLQLGWILIIQLHFAATSEDSERTKLSVICTAWPHNQSYQHTDILCIDDSVFCQQLSQHRSDWFECQCQITHAFPPRNCTSFKVSSDEVIVPATAHAAGSVASISINSNSMTGVPSPPLVLSPSLPALSGVMFMNLPLMAHCTVAITRPFNGCGAYSYNCYDNSNQGAKAPRVFIRVGEIQPSQSFESTPCLCSSGSIMIVAPRTIAADTGDIADTKMPNADTNFSNIDSSTASIDIGITHDADSSRLKGRAKNDCSDNRSYSDTSNSNSSSNSTSDSVHTAAVDQLKSILIDPILAASLCPAHRVPAFAYQGILLCGPPGIGKTYSIHALKRLYGHLCDFKLHSISIPTILADSENGLQTMMATLRSVVNEMKTSQQYQHHQHQHQQELEPHKEVGEGTDQAVASAAAVESTAMMMSPERTIVSSAVDSVSSSARSTPRNTHIYTPNSSSRGNGSEESPAIVSDSGSTSKTSFRFVHSSPSAIVSPSSASTTVRMKAGGTAAFTPTATPTKGIVPVPVVGTKTNGTTSESAFKTKPVMVGARSETEAGVLRRPVIQIITVDEIDGLGSQHSNTIMQTIIKSALCSWLDDLPRLLGTARNNDVGHTIALIGTTNKPNAVDLCLRRGGRLDREIVLVSNSSTDRAKLVALQLRSYILVRAEVCRNKGTYPGTNTDTVIDTCASKAARLDVNSPESRAESEYCTFALPLDEQLVSVIANSVSQRTGGYVAADIAMLCQTVFESATVATVATSLVSTTNDNHDNLGAPTLSHSSSTLLSKWLRLFDAAMTVVSPSCLRGISLAVDTQLSLDDVIGQTAAKAALHRVFMFASPRPAVQQLLQSFKLTTPGGVLFYGPPGNSKTRLVLATASHYKLPIISLSSADVYSAYVGEAEEEIRKVFRLARQASPCILFFDEIDALVTNRGIDGGGGGAGCGNSAESRVLATFLTELDGVGVQSSASMIFVMAATNRLDAIDPALLRKGRFDHCLKVTYPNAAECRQLFAYFGNKYKISADDIHALAEKYVGSSCCLETTTTTTTTTSATTISTTNTRTIDDTAVVVTDVAKDAALRDLEEVQQMAASSSLSSEVKEDQFECPSPPVQLTSPSPSPSPVGSLSGAQIENICKEYALSGLQQRILASAITTTTTAATRI